jgi:3-methyladenine DNA glycosylase AlkD
MPTLESIMADLESKGRAGTRKIYERHGVPMGRMFGVSVAELKVIAKTIKGQQALACELYKTGNLDAMYLAGMVADGSKMSRAQLNEWAEGAVGLSMIAEYTVAWVTVEHPHAPGIAMEWIGSKAQRVAPSGWCTYTGLLATKPDADLDIEEIAGLLARVEREIDHSENRARHTMNGFVMAVGHYVKPLLKQAKASANKIGEVFVDMGETACKVPLAVAQIEKAEAAGQLGKKRKTIRC